MRRILAACVAAVALTALALAGCASAGGRSGAGPVSSPATRTESSPVPSAPSGSGASSAPSEPSPPRVTLAAGTYRGARWRLFAWEQQGQLCMEVSPRAAGYSPAGGYSGQCEFDRRYATSSYWNGGLGPVDSTAVYGPLPMDAVAVRVASREVVRSEVLPRVAGLPRARFWVNIEAPDWPTPAEGAVLDTPVPLNASGAAAVPFAAY